MNEIKRFDLQRRVVAHMTTKSWMTIPHVSYIYEPDITDFFGEYQKLNDKKRVTDCRLSFNTIILRTIIEALKSAPELNASLLYHHKKGEGTLNISDEINICMPWKLNDGRMITPVLLNAESKSLDELSKTVSEIEDKISKTNIDELFYQAIVSDTKTELKKLNFSMLRRIIASKLSFHPIKGLSGKEKVTYYKTPEESRLLPDNLIKGTVMVSNIGSLYKDQNGHFGLLEIIPPQVFAVGVGAVQERPGIYTDNEENKSIGIRKFLPMCLAFDHRALDFNALVPFLKTMDYIFSKPDMIIDW